MDSEKGSPSSVIWVVLAAVLGMFAINLPRPASDSMPDKGADKKSKDGPTIVNKKGDPLLPLRQFFAVDKGADMIEPGATKPGIDEALKTKLAACRVKTLIVSVLDPVDSHLGYVFDQTVEVIDLAMGECGYLRDRFWLPWDDDRQDLSDGRVVGVARRTAPGVLLFRRARASRKPGESQDSLCVVFLVGETPTTGIHKPALAAALELIDAYQMRQSGQKFRLVAPACSGSEDSLQAVMRAWARQHQAKILAGLIARNAMLPVAAPVDALQVQERFAVMSHFDRVSGSATAVDLDAHDILEFKGTVRHAADVGRAVQMFFEKRNRSTHNHVFNKGRTGRMAFLIESNTGFGRTFSKKIDRTFSSKNQEEVLYLPFPVHFSRVRETVEQERQQKEAKLALPSPTSLVPQILEGKALPRDVYPSQDAGTTAAVNGEVLNVLLATIVRERIQYVGIIASDTRDQIFLAYALREYCPEVQIFVVGSDMLQTLPQYRAFMKGTVVGSTYPMFLPNQGWTGLANKRVAFPGDGAQGNYNAIVALMGHAAEMIEYQTPILGTKDKDNVREKTEPFPPIWINAIDQNGNVVPLQYFTRAGKVDYLRQEPFMEEIPEDEEEVAVPAHVSNTALAIVAFCVGCVVLLYRVFWRNWSRLIEAEDVVAVPLRWEEVLYRAVCLLALVGLLLPITILMNVFQRSSPGTDWKVCLSYLPVPLLFALLVAVIWPAPRILWRGFFGNDWTEAAGQPRYFLRAADVFACAMIGAGLIWHYAFPHNLRSWDVLFFERAMTLQSGMSPLVPLFFLNMALYFWGYFQLRRCYFSSSHRYVVDSPFSAVHDVRPSADLSLPEIRARDKDVHACLGDIVAFIRRNWQVHALLLAGIVTLFWYLANYDLLPTLEGGDWDFVFLAGFFINFVLFGLSMIRFFLTWRAVERLMTALALLPMVGAFDKLPGKIVSVFGGNLLALRTRVKRRLLCEHQLCLLATATETYCDATDDPARKLELQQIKKLALDLRAHLEGARGGRTDAMQQATVYTLCQHLIGWLTPIWNSCPTREAFGNGPVEARDDKNAAAATPLQTAQKHWIELAEEFVASWTVIYLSQFFVQLRNSAWAIMICSSLLLLAGSSYPFFPERLKLGLLLALALCGIGFVVHVLVQINKNELVSRVTRTAPNQLSLDRGFLMSLLQFAGPLIAIVVGLLGTFRFLLEPILRLLM